MNDKEKIPSTWYKYDFPIKDNENLPKPSNANYEPTNVAWLIEFFASVLNRNHTELMLVYENNTNNVREDDKLVTHPNDKIYIYEKIKKRSKSHELLRYEAAAKKSETLKKFERNSPANIKYFKNQ